MIDRGLLWSGIVMTIVAWALPRLVRGPRPSVAVDPLLVSGVVGVLVGRVVWVGVEDPAALTDLRNVLVVRGGVAFWAALAGGAANYAYLTRGPACSIWIRLGAAAPAVLAAYGAYEAMCVVRDGCFGPAADFGLTPPGFSTAILPVGWGVAILVLGWAARHQRRMPRSSDLLFAVLFLAVVRSVASFHLPTVGGELSSPHVQSIAVGVVALSVVIGRRARDRHTTPSSSRTTAATTTDE